MADRFSAHRTVSHWMATIEEDLTPRPPLPDDTDCDVAIVGAGMTGLWTALELKRRDPGLRVVVLEKEIAGFGASGRNGGWCSALFPASHDAIAAVAGRDAAVAMQRAMNDAVDEVGAACAREGIDCGYVKGGTLTAATNPAQEQRLRRAVAHDRDCGFGPEDVRWLDRDEAAGRVNVAGMSAAAFTPHCAAVNPAKLVRGLARAATRAGVKLYEATTVRSITGGTVRTDYGRVRAEVVVRATEAYTPRLRGMHRLVIPLYSLMVVTEPLGESFWDEVGWAGRETVGDARRVVVYAQRTADDRVAFGGRGTYHFASRVKPGFDRPPGAHTAVEAAMRAFFPALRDVQITHRWGGPVAAPRDWFASVGYDREAKLAWAGGYVGDGVSTTNLAGRTIADLVCGVDSDLTRLPWVGHAWRRWEPEPLRWLGVSAMSRIATSADSYESRKGRVPRLRSAVFDAVVG